MRHIKSLILAVVVAHVFLPTSVLAAATPTDVYQVIKNLEADVELIRLEMGVPSIHKTDIEVSDVQPREVYFQAMTLVEKTNRLLFEQMRERSEISLDIPLDIVPEQVLQLANKALSNVLSVKTHLNIIESLDPGTDSTQITPTDVFKLIVKVNRTLNTLLLRRFEPADVYQRVTYGISISYEILLASNNQEALGSESDYVRRKTPQDVYRKLLKLYDIVSEIFESLGRHCLTIDQSESQRNDVTPSDVYDLASLLVAELSYLHSEIANTKQPKKSYYPGIKLPSHVYQRAGRLESQLNILRSYSLNHPNWLSTQ